MRCDACVLAAGFVVGVVCVHVGWVAWIHGYGEQFLAADPEAFRARLERGDYAPLTEPARIELVSPPNSYTRFAIEGCPKCEDFYCLDVRRVDVTLDVKNRRQEKETLVVDNPIVGPEVYAALSGRYGDALEAIR